MANILTSAFQSRRAPQTFTELELSKLMAVTLAKI